MSDRDVVESFEHAGKIVEIHYDIDPQNPRTEWDNDDVMVCFHRKYNLGDEHDYKSGDYSGWEELKEQICKDNDVQDILPLYLYDHSGITMSTSDFGDRWDSGCVGFIYITKAKARESHMVKRISKRVRDIVHSNLLASVKIYDEYISGEVYGYIVKDKETEEELDSCWGFYGLDYVREQAKEVAGFVKAKSKEDPNQMQLELA